MLDEALLALSEKSRLDARIALGSTYELESSPGTGRFVEQWRIRVNARRASHIWIRVSPRFPLELPEVFVEGDGFFNVVPHISLNGKLCYCDEETTFYDPEDARRVILEVARRSIEVLDAEAFPADDFAREFHSYWSADRDFLSLLSDFETLREIDILWLDVEKSRGFSFVACEDIASGLKWLKQSGLGVATLKGKGVLLPNAFTQAPPYPRTNQEVYDWISKNRRPLLSRFESFLKKDRVDTLFLSTLPSDRGSSLFAWSHPRLKCPTPQTAKGKMHGAVPGFRPGKHPVSLEMKNWGASTPVQRYEGVRIDTVRLRRRTVGQDADNGFRHLVVIGVGALGSHISMGLIQSHEFDRLSLVDPDRLKIENVLRHACGFDDIEEAKVTALKKLAGHKCPWMTIDTRQGNALSYLPELQSWLETADLVLIATGVNVAAENELVSMCLKAGKPNLAVHRVWFTPQAQEGHLVRYVKGYPGCPKCLEAPPVLPPDVHYEPGCSPGFAQFGGSRLNRFVAVAVDAMIGPVGAGWHLTWQARSMDDPDGSDHVSRSAHAPEGACICCGE